MPNYRINAVQIRIANKFPSYTVNQIPLFVLEGDIHGISSTIQAVNLAQIMLSEIAPGEVFNISAEEI